MKNIYLFLFCIFSLQSFCQLPDTAKYQLKYQFPEGSNTVYKFSNIPMDFDSVMQGLKSYGEKWDWALKTGYERYVNNNYFIVSKEENIYKIYSTIATDSLSFSEALNIYTFYIDECGKNYSLYLSNEIDKICGFIFRLPNTKVAIGDTWKSDIDDISLGGYISKDSFLLQDEIKLSKVEKINSDILATIVYTYNIYFAGRANGDETEITMSYHGEGLFSITQGIWIHNIGIYNVSMTGLPGAKMLYSLEITDKVPTNLYEGKEWDK